MVENGATPVITTNEAKEVGFRIMIFSFASIAPAYVAIKNTLERFKVEGVVRIPKDVTTLKLFDMYGLQNLMAIDTDAGFCKWCLALTYMGFALLSNPNVLTRNWL